MVHSEAQGFRYVQRNKNCKNKAGGKSAIYTTQLVSFRSAQCILSILALHSRGGLELNFQASHVKLTKDLCINGRNTPKNFIFEITRQGRGLQLQPGTGQGQIMLDLSRARGVMEILSVPSISIEVLELAKRQNLKEYQGTSINDVPCFLAIFDLPTLSYSITSGFGGYLGPPYLP